MFLIAVSFIICVDAKLILTKSGLVRGETSTDGRGTIHKFLKIPYAQPPLKKLRFAKPVSVKPWTETLNATKYPPACMQSRVRSKLSKYAPTKDMSEDCLYLSIYVPNDIEKTKLKPVMVFIHGGGYNFGQGSIYDVTHLALSGDVIAVTFNYRLNVFGFLSTWDSVVPGNFGLWDQIMALKWVKNNIAAFGGNPQSITLFGHSEGAFSASYLSILPRNKDLFHRVILQSGSAVSAISSNNQYKEFLSYFIEAAGCNEASSSAVLECLREVPANTLTSLADMAFWDGLQNALIMPFSPRVDGLLIRDIPLNLLQNYENSEFFSSLDLMIGITDAEGASFIETSISHSDTAINIAEGISSKFVCDRVISIITLTHFNANSQVKDKICKKYSASLTEGYDDKIQQANKLVDLYTDWLFMSPAVQLSNVHAESDVSNTFQYVFTREHKMFGGTPLPHWLKGAPHASELSYLLLLDNFNEISNMTLTGKDRLLSDVMLKYWTNFAKYG